MLVGAILGCFCKRGGGGPFRGCPCNTYSLGSALGAPDFWKLPYSGIKSQIKYT